MTFLAYVVSIPCLLAAALAYGCGYLINGLSYYDVTIIVFYLLKSS